jgi:hypothetical protein
MNGVDIDSLLHLVSSAPLPVLLSPSKGRSKDCLTAFVKMPFPLGFKRCPVFRTMTMFTFETDLKC